MAKKGRRSNSSQRKSYYLPREKLEDLLKSVGVVISSDTATDLICWCPFHNNKDSPAFNISLAGPHLWKCHNGKCDSQGNIFTLLLAKGYSRSEADRMLLSGSVEISDLLSVVNEILDGGSKKKDATKDWLGVDPKRFRDSDENHNWPARDYMLSRGFTQEAIDFFGIGYSHKKGMAVIPVHNERGQLCGIIGREIESKRYQYSTGLNRGQLIWNINNARQYDSIILCEGSLDAIYLWQAGYENVGAVLGSAISPRQWDQIRKYFTEVICFFDNDDAGIALTETIIDSVKDLAVSYVEYPDRMIEHRDSNGETTMKSLKDPGDLTTQEIVSMVENRKSSLELMFQ